VSWFRRIWRTGTDERVTGFPTSSNRASSLHLHWDWGPSAPALVAVSAVLTVVDAPAGSASDHLHFWALQASFSGGGAGHVGLQHHPGHPGRTAANWGGYAGGGGGELGGTESPLPSAPGNPNTRDFVWESGRPYRLGIRRGASGWAGLVDDLVLRELHAGGDRLAGVVMWSEVFARCDDPSSAVRWSDLVGVTVAGDEVRPQAVHVNYQSVAAGGCSNTSSEPDGAGGFVQRTNTARATPQGAVLSFG
jgi:hypothetical protein